MYDIVIIGAGPAGISAGIYAVSRGRKTLIVEKRAVGGLIGNVSTVTHYAGIIEGKHVYVVGGADGAVKEALYLANYAKLVTIIHFEETLGCIAQFRDKVAQTPNIKLRFGSRLHAVHGVEQVETLEISDEKTGRIEMISDPGCGIFVYAGTTPNTELYTQLRLHNGFIPVNENQETEIAGVYAAGDICKKQVRQVATAVSDGTIAAIQAAM